MWKTVVDTASWLARTIGAPAAGGAVSVIVAVLAINVLLRAHAIEAVLADGHPVWAQMIEPVAWASLMGTVWIIGLVAWPHTLATFSPSYRLRRMAEEVDALANSLSDGKSYYWDPLGGSGAPLPRLEAEIAALKAKLRDLRVCSPPVSDSDEWNCYIPLLRGWVATGNLHAARAYLPEQESTKSSR